MSTYHYLCGAAITTFTCTDVWCVIFCGRSLVYYTACTELHNLRRLLPVSIAFGRESSDWLMILGSWEKLHSLQWRHVLYNTIVLLSDTSRIHVAGRSLCKIYWFSVVSHCLRITLPIYTWHCWKRCWLWGTAWASYFSLDRWKGWPNKSFGPTFSECASCGPWMRFRVGWLIMCLPLCWLTPWIILLSSDTLSVLPADTFQGPFLLQSVEVLRASSPFEILNPVSATIVQGVPLLSLVRQIR